MKIGDLADVLQKNPQELSEAYKIEGDEIDFDKSKEILKKEIDLALKNAYSKSKNEGFQYGERKTKDDFEKRLKADFGVDGDNLDSLLESLKSKTATDDDKSKYAEQIAHFKDELKKTKAEYESYKVESIRRENFGKVVSKIESVVGEKYDISQERLKSLAIKSFIDSHDVDVDGDELTISLKGSKKPIFESLDEYAAKYFDGILPPKSQQQQQQPPRHNGNPSPNVQNDDLMSLLTELRREKDPARREAINQKINADKKKN